MVVGALPECGRMIAVLMACCREDVVGVGKGKESDG